MANRERNAQIPPMRRDITWIEKLPDRIKREVRVHFHGGKIYWRERQLVGRREAGPWNDGMQPSEEDWERLHEEVMRRYQRRTARQEDVDLVLKRAIGTKRGLPSQRFGKEL